MIRWWKSKTITKLVYCWQRFRVGWWNSRGKNREARMIRRQFYHSIWRDAAKRFDAEMTVLSGDIVEVVREGYRVRFLQNDTPLDDYVTLKVAADKPLTYRLMQDEGIATAPFAVFSLDNIEKGLRFLDETEGDCIVKPAQGWGGVGVTTGIKAHAQLATAAAAASVYGGEIIVQKQVYGDCYRIVFLNGKLLDAVVRRSPSVMADGTRTVSQLVEQLNQRRLEQGSNLSQALLSTDLDMKSTLTQQGLSLASQPSKGTVVRLKTVINDNCATENATATGMLCESIIRDCAAAAEVVGVHLAGVDIITPDPTVPLKEAGGAVIEVNTAPGQYWHYHKGDGVFPLADHILGHLLAESPECGLESEEVEALLNNTSAASRFSSVS